MGLEGFTLVELMIAVAIIGIIASLAIPNFKRYKSRALESEKFSNVKSLYLGASAYYQTQHVRGAGVTVSDAARCLPVSPKSTAFGGDGAAVANAVLAPPIAGILAWGGKMPATFDWSSDPLWPALGFSLDAPSYAGYLGHVAGGLTTSGQCDVPSDSGSSAVYQVGAYSDLDGNGAAGWLVLYLGARDGSLYRQRALHQQEY